MTKDHIDAFSDALDKEKRGYLICVHHGLHLPVSGAHVRIDLDNWPTPERGCGSAHSKAHDILLAIVAAINDDEDPGFYYTVVRSPTGKSPY